MVLEVGEVFDRYRLRARLGAGAFGEVWRADQLVEGREVGISCAIKIMRLPPSGRSPIIAKSLAGSWLEEVRTLLSVQAEGTIPRIFNADVWNDHAYIAMELLVGRTLFERLRAGPIPFRRALFIADQITIALEAAHQLNFVHRDLKPQNVVLVGARRACVIDWGIAQLRATVEAPHASRAVRMGSVQDPNATDMTNPTVLLEAPRRPRPTGTPGYISPESYDFEPIGTAQDAYALGVVLYEMLTGELPHRVEPVDRRRDSGELSSEQVLAYRDALARATMEHDFVPLRERVPNVPSAVVELVDALLSERPEARPVKLRAAIERVARFPNGVPERPYAGLNNLGPEHGGLFFGQNETVALVLKRLETERGALLWGPSGSGKSSVALAGVAVHMDRTLFRDTDGWVIHAIRPSETHVLGLVPTAEPDRTGLGHVVVVDQLEEIVDLPVELREEFARALVALLEGSAAVHVRNAVIDPRCEIRVLATVRDDFEARVDHEVPALRPLLERRVIVSGVDANFARSILEEPARAVGYQIENVAIVAREIEEHLSRDAANLPMIQFALNEWWEQRDSVAKTLPFAAWQQLGGVAGTLSFVAERFYAELDTEQLARAKAIFLRFFRDARRQLVASSELVAGDRALVEALVARRLVGKRERPGKPPFYEVEHEALAKSWKRLSTWLEESRVDRELAEELERDAAEWNESGRDAEWLWKKRRLVAAEGLLSEGDVELSVLAREFVEAARAAARRGKILLASGVAAFVAASAAAVTIYVTTLRASEQVAVLMRKQAETAEVAAKEAKQTVQNTNAELAAANRELSAASERVRSQREAYRMDLKQLREEIDKASIEKLKEIQIRVRAREGQNPSASVSVTPGAVPRSVEDIGDFP